MASHVRWGLPVRAAVIAFLAPIVCLAAYVPIQQHILRWRAGRLLADVRQIQIGKSTSADAQRLMRRWARWSTYNGSCDQDNCHDWIQIQDNLWYLRSSCGAPCAFLRLTERPYEWLGGRASMAEAELVVTSGRITRAGFSLFLEVPAGRSREYPAEHGLVGHATEYSAGFDPYNFREQRLLHPEYWIGKPGGCEGCVKLDTGFTPLAGERKIMDLTDFDLSCITRWSQCATEADILPLAWKEYEEEEPGDEVRERAFEKCEVSPEFFGREYQDIVIAQILSSQMLREPNRAENVIELRIIRSLKGTTPPLPETRPYVIVLDKGQGVPGWNSTDLVAGKQYILMGSFGKWGGSGTFLALDDCGAVPYTEQKLAAIQRGINISLGRSNLQ